MIKNEELNIVDLPLGVELVSPTDKDIFFSELRGLGKDVEFTNLLMDSDKEGIDVFKVVKRETGELLGMISMRNYDKKEKTKALILKFPCSIDNTLKMEALNIIINYAGQDNSVEYLSIKVPEEDKDFSKLVEKNGFMKDGLYFSNGGDRSFRYYNRYTYKLV